MSRNAPTGHEMRGAPVPPRRVAFERAAIDRITIDRKGHRMIGRLWGLIAPSTAALLAVGLFSTPGAADTLPVTTVINGPYTLVGGDSVSFSAPPASGSTGATSSGDYFDYLFEFSIGKVSYITATVGPVGGSAFSEMHMQFYDNTAPTGSDNNLYTGGDLAALYTDPANPNPNLIDTGPDAHWSTSGSVGGSGGGPVLPSGATAVLEPTGFDQATQTPYHLLSLSGTYFLRVFGILDPSATELALSATISTSLSVATAPIPAALPLFLTAIGGLGFLARRRKVIAAA
jgi:hypothetical protein